MSGVLSLFHFCHLLYVINLYEDSKKKKKATEGNNEKTTRFSYKKSK